MDFFNILARGFLTAINDRGMQIWENVEEVIEGSCSPGVLPACRKE